MRLSALGTVACWPSTPAGTAHYRRLPPVPFGCRQRSYEAIWVDALVLARDDLDDVRAQGLVVAVLSLLNAAAHMPASLDDATVEAMLNSAAAAALFCASNDRLRSTAG